MTFTGWELGRNEPQKRLRAKVAAYLGNEPWAKPKALGGIS